jgi:hypothetical protein
LFWREVERLVATSFIYLCSLPPPITKNYNIIKEVTD